jgi:hypothetical protein
VGAKLFDGVKGCLDKAAAAGDCTHPGNQGPALKAAANAMIEQLACALDPGCTTNGPPITAPDLTWTWVPFPDARCRDGSSTGIGVNLKSASTQVLIVLQGGGACSNGVDCPGNRTHFGQSDFDALKVSDLTLAAPFVRVDDPNPCAGCFPHNPFKDWNFVFVPYCTGDWHAGNNPSGVVPDVGPQVFVGYSNIGTFLRRLVPTFENATNVFLTGSSAGGVGAYLNYDQVSRAFGAIPVTMLDDAVPPMTNTYLTACLQTYGNMLWGLDKTTLMDCGSACTASNGFIEFAEFLADKYPKRRMGYLSSMADINMRNYVGGGLNNCHGAPFTADMWAAGLTEMRAILRTRANVGTFFFAGEDHTSMYTLVERTTSSGEKLSDWVTALVAGSVSHVGP